MQVIEGLKLGFQNVQLLLEIELSRTIWLCTLGFLYNLQEVIVCCRHIVKLEWFPDPLLFHQYRYYTRCMIR